MTMLASQLIGTWRLLSREDLTASGERRVDPGLGANPLALLVYDAAGNFAAQFMKRDRSRDVIIASDRPDPLDRRLRTKRASVNNTMAANGYDAYFGTYTVDEASGSVTQILEGSLSPGDVGKIVTRQMRVEGDHLIIQLATTSGDGEPVSRTLVWLRSA